MTWVLYVTTTVSTAAALLKWLRVSQREHYIPGSVISTCLKWSRASRLAITSAAVYAATVVAALTLPIESWIKSLLLAFTALVAFWPPGLPLIGTPRLSFTRRMATLTGFALVVEMAFTSLAWVGFNTFVALALAPVLTIPSIEAATVLVGPLERQKAARFRSVASQRLSDVNPTIVAVTGSWGKTSTKNHIADLLGSDFDVVASPASWNNQAGLSRAINEHLRDDTQIFVAEMGMYKPGEIRSLCSWIRPDVAVVTAVGPMHLERTGSIERIAAAKSEIVERCSVAVLWVEDPLVATIVASRVPPTARVWKVGYRGTPDLDVEIFVEEDGSSLLVSHGGVPIGQASLRSGIHPGNVGCAVAASLSCGAEHLSLTKRLPELTAPPSRGAGGVSKSGLVVIDDTFNSNPQGLRRAIDRLVDVPARRRILITPGVVELGPIQFVENAEIGRYASEVGIELVAVGRTNRRALRSGYGPLTVTVRSRAKAVHWVETNLKEGDAVLWANDLPNHYP